MPIPSLDPFTLQPDGLGMTYRLLCGLFLLIAVSGTGCHCCEHFENGLGDVVDEVGQISAIRKPWFHHACETDDR